MQWPLSVRVPYPSWMITALPLDQKWTSYKQCCLAGREAEQKVANSLEDWLAHSCSFQKPFYRVLIPVEVNSQMQHTVPSVLDGRWLEPHHHFNSPSELAVICQTGQYPHNINCNQRGVPRTRSHVSTHWHRKPSQKHMDWYYWRLCCGIEYSERHFGVVHSWYLSERMEGITNNPLPGGDTSVASEVWVNNRRRGPDDAYSKGFGKTTIIHCPIVHPWTIQLYKQWSFMIISPISGLLLIETWKIVPDHQPIIGLGRCRPSLDGLPRFIKQSPTWWILSSKHCWSHTFQKL